MPDALETIAKDMGEMKQKLDQIVHAILGDPNDQTKPYVLIRLDRLERSDRNKTKIIWALATGMLAVGGNFVLTLF